MGEPNRDAAAVWCDLLEGRSTVLDCYDAGGRRFLVVGAAVGRHAFRGLARRVLAFVRDGHSNKAIAYELGVAESTISASVSEAAGVLGARSRVELVRLLNFAERR